ncbi:MAG: Probable zinc protease pqqL, partial [uncultured Gemmatimonadaceae bacterium]
HTAFNGTRNFPKNELVGYLQSIGVRFGADLNANTGFDATTYILPIPTDTARIVERGFQILEDWAHGQRFDSAEVANERGIVLEEWRGGQGSGERMLRQWLPVALRGSRYAERLPIGTRESIQAATPAKLRRFYQDWYRPDLMAVVAVGDFDKARIEQLVRQHFGRIAPRATPRPRLLAGVPGNREPLIAVATDREATSSGVTVAYKRPHEATRTVGDYRRGLLQELYLSMLNGRLGEIAQRPGAPFLGAAAGSGSFFARTTDAFTLSAGVEDGKVARGLEALLVEARRVDRFGFLAAELEREKQDLLRGYERAYAEREKTNSGAYVAEYVGHFLEGDAFPGIAYEYALVRQLLPAITLADVNTLARGWIADSNRVIVAQAPDKAGVRAPTREELLAAFERAARAPLAPYTETLSAAPLVARAPAPGRVASERRVPEVGVTEWRLSNGARVLIKPTDFKADEVLMAAYSPGGTSLAPDERYMSATQAAQVVALSGLGDFNRVDLGKKLSGKAASVGATIGETTEGLSGRASPADLETLFQLTHLHFTRPRLDSAAFQAFRAQAAQVIANRGQVPEQAFADTVQVTMSGGSFRDRPLTAATFAEVDPAQALAFYKERFADAGDFTFVFVGNVSPAALRPLVERYIASLPAAGRRERFRDTGGAPPRGVVTKVVRRGVEPKATTLLLFTGPFEYTPENRFALLALTELFQIRLTEALREQLGGTYSPSVGGGGSREPRAEYTVQIGYGSSPENADRLTSTVLALVDTLQRRGPSAADVAKVREQLARGREVQLKQNAYWLGNIAGRDQAGEPLAGLLAPYDAMIRALSPAQVQAAARKYLDTKNYARFTLLPEGAAR